LKKALEILEACPGHCDASCYRCLRTFRNKLDHSVLDRFVGAQLLRHVLYDTVPQFTTHRAKASLELLANELERLFAGVWAIERDYSGASSKGPVGLRRVTDGKQVWIDVHSPIAPAVRVFGSTSPGTEIVDELRLRKHLPEAVEQVVKAMNAS